MATSASIVATIQQYTKNYITHGYWLNSRLTAFSSILRSLAIRNAVQVSRQLYNSSLTQYWCKIKKIYIWKKDGFKYS